MLRVYCEPMDLYKLTSLQSDVTSYVALIKGFILSCFLGWFKFFLFSYVSYDSMYVLPHTHNSIIRCHNSLTVTLKPDYASLGDQSGALDVWLSVYKWHWMLFSCCFHDVLFQLLSVRCMVQHFGRNKMSFRMWMSVTCVLLMPMKMFILKNQVLFRSSSPK